MYLSKILSESLGPLFSCSTFVACLTIFKVLESCVCDRYIVYIKAVSFPAVFLSVLPILCTIWFILDDVASIIATLTSGTSYPISNVCTESSGKNSFPHSDRIFCLFFELNLLSISMDFIPLFCNISFSFSIDSIVSLNTIILSEGCFVAIISTAANSLLLAQLIKFFLSLTFANHVFASPAERPPLLNREVIDFGSEV